MPEPLLFLLVPVLALLFLNLRLSRKLRYPHDLLKAENRRGMASLLFRYFRTHYDVLLDGAIALALAFAMVPPKGARPAAVVIDGSRSMVAGLRGDWPLEKALKRIHADPSLRGAEPFLLAFDSKAGGTQLVPITTWLADAHTEDSVRHLRDSFDFFAPDYGRLVELRQRGYGEITLLTDQLRVQPEGFRFIELGRAVNFAVYPSGVRFDRASQTWLVTLAESGLDVPLAISVWDQAEERFLRLAPDRYRVEAGVAGRVVRFPAPGLYLLSLRGPYGLDDIDLPMVLAPRQVAATAAGSFSERMLSVFTDIDRAAPPAFVLADRGAKAPPGKRTVTTAVIPENAAYVLDPAAAGGALIAMGSAPGLDLVLGPSSLKNEDLVLAYAAILAQAPPPFLTRTPSGTKQLLPVGTSYLAAPGLPLIVPPSAFFETRPGQRLVLPPPGSRRWPWALLLACLTAVKLAAWSSLSGKSLLTRD
jgi:hypothetical protein